MVIPTSIMQRHRLYQNDVGTVIDRPPVGACHFDLRLDFLLGIPFFFAEQIGVYLLRGRGIWRKGFRTSNARPYGYNWTLVFL